MATSQGSGVGTPHNPGIVDLEVGTYTVRPNFALNAVEIEIEIVNPIGDGVRFWLDLGAWLDLAMRLVASCMRLRGLTP